MHRHMQSLQQSLLEKSNQLRIKPTQVLLVFNLQNEFISPEGKLPCSDFAFVDRIKQIVPKFRENAGDVIWIRSEYQVDRRVNDGSADADQVILGLYKPGDATLSVPDETLSATSTSGKAPSSGKKGLVKKKSRHMSNIFKPKKKQEPIPIPSSEPIPVVPVVPGAEELFLTSSLRIEQRCIPGTIGAEFFAQIGGSVLPSDTTMITSYYSAVKGTHLINILRSKMVREVYICGCMSNLSIYATIADMLGHGFVINLIEDCLGFRSLEDHEEGLKVMLAEDKMGLGKISSKAMVEDLENPQENESQKAKADVKGLGSSTNKISSALPSIAGIAESLDAMTLAEGKGKLEIEADDTDAIFDEIVIRNARPSNSTPNSNGTVKNKIRMRSRATPKPPKDSQDQALVALQKKSTTGTQPTTSKPTLSPDAQAQVFAALERLSIAEGENSRAKSEEALKKAKGSSKSRGAAATTQPPPPPLDSSPHFAKSRDVIKNTTTWPAEYPNESKISEEKEKGKNTDIVKKETQAMETKAPEAESIRPSHQTSAEPVSAVPEVYQPSNSPGKKPQTAPQPSSAKSKLRSLANLPTLGPDNTIGEGDSFIRYNLLPLTLRDEINPALPLGETIFHALYHEVKWQKMYHAAGEVPRLVAVQGAVSAKGDKPLYRHPSDQSPPLLPFTKNVDFIRLEAEKVIGHEVNHVLIQLYRDGKDFISEHSDKTLDVVHGSKIVNASFGAQRTMRLRTKKSGAEAAAAAAASEAAETDDIQRQTQRVAMPNNSLFALGLLTNKIWLHGITADKRLPADRSPAELAYNGMRISLTFRYIGTFLDKDEKIIWGQGAVGKTRDEARKVVNGDEKETERMIFAFGKENKEGAGFDWNEFYGGGFDVLHFREADGGS